MFRQSMFALLLFAHCAFASKNGEVLPLWPGGAPGSEGMADRKEVLTQPAKPGDSLKVLNIHNPSLILYFPPKARRPGRP